MTSRKTHSRRPPKRTGSQEQNVEMLLAKNILNPIYIPIKSGCLPPCFPRWRPRARRPQLYSDGARNKDLSRANSPPPLAGEPTPLQANVHRISFRSRKLTLHRQHDGGKGRKSYEWKRLISPNPDLQRTHLDAHRSSEIQNEG